jgi:hypothetical protein
LIFTASLIMFVTIVVAFGKATSDRTQQMLIAFVGVFIATFMSGFLYGLQRLNSQDHDSVAVTAEGTEYDLVRAGSAYSLVASARVVHAIKTERLVDMRHGRSAKQTPSR